MKALIVDNFGESKYRVELLRDEAKRDLILGEQQGVIDNLVNTRIPEAKQADDDAKDAVDAAISDYNSAESAYIVAVKSEAEQSVIDAAAKEMSAALNMIEIANAAKRQTMLSLSLVQAFLIRARERKRQLDASVQAIRLECWTSYWDDTLTTGEEVEVVLVPGEPYSCTIHTAGITNDSMTPVLWQTPAQALFNYMMLPGWQKWQYRFSTARVTRNPSDGMVPVEVYDKKSSAQSLSVGRDLPPALAMSPEGYYQAGEIVLVDHSGEQPVIVGYYIEPLIKWVARYAGRSFMEFTSIGPLVLAIIDEWPNIVCEWKKNPLDVYSPLTDIVYYGDNEPGSRGITWYDSSPSSFSYPSVTLQEYDAESYIRIDVDKYNDSRDYGTHSYRIRSKVTGKVYAEATILVNSKMYNQVSASTSNPIPQELWENSLPIYPIE